MAAPNAVMLRCAEMRPSRTVRMHRARLPLDLTNALWVVRSRLSASSRATRTSSFASGCE